MPETTNEAVAAAHAFASAVCYRAPKDLIDQLLAEAHAAAGGYEAVMAATTVLLRLALDELEANETGARDRFLSNVGQTWAANDITTE